MGVPLISTTLPMPLPTLWAGVLVPAFTWCTCTTTFGAVVGAATAVSGVAAGTVSMEFLAATACWVQVMAVTMPKMVAAAKLRKAQANYYGRRLGVDIDPETEVVVTMGSKEGLASLATAITEPGDVVLCPNPSYPNLSRQNPTPR